MQFKVPGEFQKDGNVYRFFTPETYDGLKHLTVKVGSREYNMLASDTRVINPIQLAREDYKAKIAEEIGSIAADNHIFCMEQESKLEFRIGGYNFDKIEAVFTNGEEYTPSTSPSKLGSLQILADKIAEAFARGADPTRNNKRGVFTSWFVPYTWLSQIYRTVLTETDRSATGLSQIEFMKTHTRFHFADGTDLNWVGGKTYYVPKVETGGLIRSYNITQSDFYTINGGTYLTYDFSNAESLFPELLQFRTDNGFGIVNHANIGTLGVATASKFQEVMPAIGSAKATLADMFGVPTGEVLLGGDETDDALTGISLQVKGFNHIMNTSYSIESIIFEIPLHHRNEDGYENKFNAELSGTTITSRNHDDVNYPRGLAKTIINCSSLRCYYKIGSLIDQLDSNSANAAPLIEFFNSNPNMGACYNYDPDYFTLGDPLKNTKLYTDCINANYDLYGHMIDKEKNFSFKTASNKVNAALGAKEGVTVISADLVREKHSLQTRDEYVNSTVMLNSDGSATVTMPDSTIIYCNTQTNENESLLKYAIGSSENIIPQTGTVDDWLYQYLGIGDFTPGQLVIDIKEYDLNPEVLIYNGILKKDWLNDDEYNRAVFTAYMQQSKDLNRIVESALTMHFLNV